jgi:hypothetical protein
MARVLKVSACCIPVSGERYRRALVCWAYGVCRDQFRKSIDRLRDAGVINDVTEIYLDGNQRLRLEVPLKNAWSEYD